MGGLRWEVMRWEVMRLEVMRLEVVRWGGGEVISSNPKDLRPKT